MITVLGFDAEYNARAVEIKEANQEEVKKILEEQGWTSLIFINK